MPGVRAPARVPFLDEACGDDLEIRPEIESLLAAEQEAVRFLSSAVLSPVTELEPTGQHIGRFEDLVRGAAPSSARPAASPAPASIP